MPIDNLVFSCFVILIFGGRNWWSAWLRWIDDGRQIDFRLLATPNWSRCCHHPIRIDIWDSWPHRSRCQITERSLFNKKWHLVLWYHGPSRGCIIFIQESWIWNNTMISWKKKDDSKYGLTSFNELSTKISMVDQQNGIFAKALY